MDKGKGKGKLPADPITARGIRELWGVSRQRTRDRMSTKAFRAACPVRGVVDGIEVYSKAQVLAYTKQHAEQWTA